MNEIKPDGLNLNGDWEIKCYYHYNEKKIINFYLNVESSIKGYKVEDSSFIGNENIYNGILNFDWTTTKSEGNEY